MNCQVKTRGREAENDYVKPIREGRLLESFNTRLRPARLEGERKRKRKKPDGNELALI